MKKLFTQEDIEEIKQLQEVLWDDLQPWYTADTDLYEQPNNGEKKQPDEDNQ